MDNPEKTEGAIKNGQSRETDNKTKDKQSKNTTQYVLDTTICKQTQIRHEPMKNIHGIPIHLEYGFFFKIQYFFL